MGKNKLKKFKDMESIPFVFQYPFGILKEQGFPLKGKWHTGFFKNNNPIVVELGCGKGEYTVGLAQRFPDKNFIGIDIKGARMWTGANQASVQGLANVAFIRTNIELITSFFFPGEVSEIWITFPDPQMKKTRKRLTSTRFLDLYREVMADGGYIHLKSDSPFLYTYTRLLASHNELPVEFDIPDLYSSEVVNIPDSLRSIRTFYEQQWLDRGLSIKYLSFKLPHGKLLEEIEEEIPLDTYRPFSRGNLQMPQLMH